jgi:hypothetical protein
MDICPVTFHDCSELPSVPFETDRDCLDRIVSIFSGVNWRGNGQSGFVIETGAAFGNPPRNESLIVKIGPVVVTEIEIACELNGLIGETPVFTHTFGWLICQTIPDPWHRILQLKARDHKLLKTPPLNFMFTFGQPVQYDFDDFSLLDNHGYRVALFFLLHGLYCAAAKIGFRHGDIHSGNVRVQKRAPQHQREPTMLRYGIFEIEVTSDFVPRFIDYGRSTTHRYKDTHTTNDLRQLREMFAKRLDEDGDDEDSPARSEMIAFNLFVANSKWWAELEDRYPNEGPDVILALLNHSYFEVDEIQRHQIKRPAPATLIETRCFHCCAPESHYRIDHKGAATSKYFCHPSCYESIHGVVRFIK